MIYPDTIGERVERWLPLARDRCAAAAGACGTIDRSTASICGLRRQLLAKGPRVLQQMPL